MATGDKTIIASKNYVNTLDNARRQEIGSVTAVKPVIDLDFAKNEYEIYDSVDSSFVKKPIADILTVTNGIGSIETPRGRIENTSASNTARLTFKDCVPQGLLVEEQRTNLLTEPRIFTNRNFVNASILPYNHTGLDGNYNASAFVPTADLNNHYMVIENFTGSASTEYTYTFVVEKNTYDYFYFQASTANGWSTTYRFQFEFSTETATALDAVGLISYKKVGNKYLVYVTMITDATVGTKSGLISFKPSSGTGVSYTGSGIVSGYIEYIQVEQGSFPTSLIPESATFTSRASTGTYWDSTGTLQTAAVDTARYTYNPADLSAPPVLIDEDSSTNSILYSEDFSQSVWAGTAYSGTITTFSGIDFSLLTDADGASSLFKYQDVTIADDSNTHVVCAHVKQYSTDNSVRIVIQLRNGTTETVDRFDIDFSTGTVSHATVDACSDANVKYRGNGVYEVWCTVTNNSTGNTALRTLCYPAGQGGVTDTGSCYFGAMDVRLNQSYYDSYIPTTSSQVTRAADVVSYAQSTRSADNITRTLGHEFNPKEGTFFFEFDSSSFIGGVTQSLLNICRSTEAFGPRHQFSKGGVTNQITYAIVDNAGGVTSMDLPVTSDKVLFGFTETDMFICVGGVFETRSITTGGASSLPTYLDLIKLFQNANSGQMLNSTCKKMLYFPKALSEAEAIALTS